MTVLIEQIESLTNVIWLNKNAKSVKEKILFVKGFVEGRKLVTAEF